MLHYNFPVCGDNGMMCAQFANLFIIRIIRDIHKGNNYIIDWFLITTNGMIVSLKLTNISHFAKNKCVSWILISSNFWRKEKYYFSYIFFSSPSKSNVFIKCSILSSFTLFGKIYDAIVRVNRHRNPRKRIKIVL